MQKHEITPTLCDQQTIFTTPIPTYLAGPVRIHGDYANGDFIVPLATYEKPLFNSINRGCKATREQGIITLLEDAGWTRAPVFAAPSAKLVRNVTTYVREHFETLKTVAEETTRYGKLTYIEPVCVGNHLHLRMSMLSGEAAGHNMTTIAADAVATYLCKKFPYLTLITVSGNLCTDKKPSAVNSLLKRGKKVIAETLISEEMCETMLKTTPAAIHLVNRAKHEGSILAGSICSANAHYANILAAMYLATGQDTANIVEGSQGITSTEIDQGNLYFAVTIPNIIAGTVGGGTKLPAQSATLERILGQGEPTTFRAKKLAEIIAATVLAGELSLLAALSNPHELVRAHKKIERGK